MVWRFTSRVINGLITPLKNAFRRIFALTVNKDGFIKEYEFWTDSKWEWHIHLKRILFNWKIKIWESFLDILNLVSISLMASDKASWSHTINGIFNPKSFKIMLEKFVGMEVSIESYICKGSLHPKLNYFVGKLWKVASLLLMCFRKMAA